MRLPSLSRLSRVRYVVSHGVGPSGATTPGLTDDDERGTQETSLRKMVICPGQEVVVVAIVGDQRRGKIGDMPSRRVRLLLADQRSRPVDGAQGHCFLGRPGVRRRRPRVPLRLGRSARTVHGEPTVSSMARRRGGHHMPSTRHLVVSGGRLLMVHRVLRSDATSEFTVFRADLTRRRWEEVESVAAHTALFVGRWGSVSRARVTVVDAREQDPLIVDDDDAFSRHHFGGYPFCGEQFGAYDITDGKTYPLLPPRELHNDSDTPATWLFPRVNDQAPS
ncbi:hypothetical protein HU200_002454 [Digitaria exilis]|uniref:KIB1-4 beta-propeller domain-containing protein n=1 Tax=Digitaria exilis TaxID=1010633 RepID=A0A835FWT4_9POAL|nr:hypothetical protein HU200_002454 [Digitaria exilis]